MEADGKLCPRSQEVGDIVSREKTYKCDDVAGITHNGRRMEMKRSRSGKGFIFDVDGKKIKVSDDQFTLMYIFFTTMSQSINSEKSGRVEQLPGYQ